MILRLLLLLIACDEDSKPKSSWHNAVQLYCILGILSDCLHRVFFATQTEIQEPISVSCQLLLLHELETGLCVIAVFQHTDYLLSRFRYRPFHGTAAEKVLLGHQPCTQFGYPVLL